MIKRTAIEVDEQLLDHAKRALGRATTCAMIEEALQCGSEAATGLWPRILAALTRPEWEVSL